MEERLLVSAKEAASLLSVSRAKFYSMFSTGRLGPLPVSFGKAQRWSTCELRRWVDCGCPNRDKWVELKGKET